MPTLLTAAILLFLAIVALPFVARKVPGALVGVVLLVLWWGVGVLVRGSN